MEGCEIRRKEDKANSDACASDVIAIIIGGKLGDEGKGTMVDYMTRRLKAGHVIRYNGGAQAAHHVVYVDEDGAEITHCFAQLGCGTPAGALTVLSDKMLIDPIRMQSEAQVLESKGVQNPLSLITIDPDCLVISPFQALLNQMLELSRGAERHGSCGIGVGQTVEDSRRLGKMSLRARDMFCKDTLHRKLDFLWRFKLDLAEQLVEKQPDNVELIERLEKLQRAGFVEDLVESYYDFATNTSVKIKRVIDKVLCGRGSVVYEAAQGALLDEILGLLPFATYSNTTARNADEQIAQSGTDKTVVYIVVMRAYETRHGRGPLVSEDEELGKLIPDMHNGTNDWQEHFRIGWFDLVASRYALECIGHCDALALTCLDRLDGFEKIKVCRAYECPDVDRELLEKYFETEIKYGKVYINKIKFQPAPTQSRQYELTRLLMKCRPVYMEIAQEEYIEFLEQALAVDIAIVSRGPSASDKIERGPLLENMIKSSDSVKDKNKHDDIELKLKLKFRALC
jgi:adenylosuccinate synthase